MRRREISSRLAQVAPSLRHGDSAAIAATLNEELRKGTHRTQATLRSVGTFGRGRCGEKASETFPPRLLMADTVATDSAAPAAAERSPRARMRRPSMLSVRHDAPLEGAGNVTPTTGEEEEVPDVEAGCKRGRSNEVAVGDRPAATTGTDGHVADDPSEGAIAPSQPCHGLIASRGCASQVALR